MSRRTAREIAFKIVYQYCMVRVEDSLTYEDLIDDADDITDDDIAYIKQVYHCVTTNFDSLKELISKWSDGFSFDRIYKVDLSILLVALSEIYYIDAIPPLVSVNEAVELSKIYSTDKSSGFINGILATALRNIT